MNRGRRLGKKAELVAHLLDLATEFGPGPDEDQIRCGADFLASVMTLNRGLVTCEDCKRPRGTT